MWFVIVVQIVLSIATLVALFVTVAWVRSSAREGRETKRLLENLSALFHRLYGVATPESSARVADEPAPSTVESSRPLAVKLGAEVVELDAETKARIEALAGDINAGRIGGDLLQRVIDAGLANAEQGDRISGEVRREPRADDSDEEAPGATGKEPPKAR